MRNPLAAWRAGVRWPLALLALVAALVVAVLVCEAIGWPFLVGAGAAPAGEARSIAAVVLGDEAGGALAAFASACSAACASAQRRSRSAPRPGARRRTRCWRATRA